MRSTTVVPSVVSLLALISPVLLHSADVPADEATLTIPLTVDTGVPIRVYLTRRLTKRLGETVHARLIEPVFAFDREVIPANTEAIGQVVRIAAVSKMRRATALAGGDFTPLHDAQVEFTTLIFPDGRHLSIHTKATLGLNSIYHPSSARSKKKPANPPAKPGLIGTAKQQASDRIHEKIATVTDMVKGPGKMEYVEDYVVKKLPYHPQWIRRGTRFDAELLAPLQFGSAQTPSAGLKLVGTPPPPDSILHVRLITPVNSSDAAQGDKVEAMLSRPLMSADNKLILPVGTRLTGAVTQAHAARWFHRGGQVRFSFHEIELPQNLTIGAHNTLPAMATLSAVEPSAKAPVKVDSEGGVKASEPKTRFIAPVISLFIATRAADNDEHRARLEGNGTGNTGGRTLGGAAGFGVFGMIAAQESPTFAGVMGFYGLGWSVFNNVIARGAEVDFGKNSAMDIRLGTRVPPTASKARASL